MMKKVTENLSFLALVLGIVLVVGCNGSPNGNEPPVNCDNSSPTWTARVSAIVGTQCRSCHSGSSASGGIRLSNFSEVKSAVNSGVFQSVIGLSGGFSSMPPSGPLSQCDLDAIQIWIGNGALED